MLITDGQAFEKLFREHYLLLCNYAGKYIIDSQVREDIVQVFFISIWEKKHLNVTQETFLPYAYRSIKNSCINYYKSEIIKDDFITTLSEEWKDQLNEEEDFIYQKEVQQALQKLPEKCRKVFLLKCVTGLRYKEISEISNISVNTVKYHLGEAFRIMREELKDLKWILFLIHLQL
ncbi:MULTISPECIES: RNA polymerase sigma-70 factor [Parabacteroides]|jgi:RNA polymerase sigma-70 factor|uniref:RNA polymerase sigma-70 factor (ECF subfamily) n=1 Tax=Parabacteroides faecis TaxID=1217282 RepID=A0ABR6KFU9_9BACT|nr:MULTISPECIES: RNA polymerase sigma-70 factor [Parabacteroides]MBB4620379.1 RNA polymerase sigma-70 factor (ECF subfamily) [Parabacteroides faecis]RHR42029.1 RNA polymerase sigma-70 factor [Parabacteroides sp. AF18-52]GGJ96957.1 RNA polymerase sigma-70 factor [Parabacteroides faecis]